MLFLSIVVVFKMIRNKIHSTNPKEVLLHGTIMELDYLTCFREQMMSFSEYFSVEITGGDNWIICVYSYMYDTLHASEKHFEKKYSAIVIGQLRPLFTGTSIAYSTIVE